MGKGKQRPDVSVVYKQCEQGNSLKYQRRQTFQEKTKGYQQIGYREKQGILLFAVEMPYQHKIQKQDPGIGNINQPQERIPE